MKKRIATILTAAMITLTIASCGTRTTPEPAQGAEGNGQGTEQVTERTKRPMKESPVPQELRDVLLGDWQDLTSRRAVMEIFEGETEEEKDFCARISWADSYSEETVWEMNVGYDPATGELSYTNGKKSFVAYSDGGVIDKEDLKWDGSEGKLTVKGGELLWEDSKEEDAGKFVFTRVYSNEISSEDYKENMFKILTTLEEGTAGSSLKAAQAAQEILSFATSRQIWNMEANARNAGIAKAWDGLTDEEKKLVKQYFGKEGSVAWMIEDAFYDYDSVKGVFEDAGVADDMEALSQNIYARRSFEALHAAVEALE